MAAGIPKCCCTAPPPIHSVRDCLLLMCLLTDTCFSGIFWCLRRRRRMRRKRGRRRIVIIETKATPQFLTRHQSAYVCPWLLYPHIYDLRELHTFFCMGVIFFLLQREPGFEVCGGNSAIQWVLAKPGRHSRPDTSL